MGDAKLEDPEVRFERQQRAYASRTVDEVGRDFRKAAKALDRAYTDYSEQEADIMDLGATVSNAHDLLLEAAAMPHPLCECGHTHRHGCKALGPDGKPCTCTSFKLVTVLWPRAR